MSIFSKGHCLDNGKRGSWACKGRLKAISTKMSQAPSAVCDHAGKSPRTRKVGVNWLLDPFTQRALMFRVNPNEVLQKMKQFTVLHQDGFADIAYRFWLQNRSKFENFTQFISWFSICFTVTAKRHLRAKPPLAARVHAWCRHSVRCGVTHRADSLLTVRYVKLHM